MKDLKIGHGFALPENSVTNTLVVYGGKGMGKTNLAAVLVEEMAEAGLRWAWLDPLGVSWGLRHSADGKGPGVECLILGGPHGDIPIEPAGGAAVADVVVEETVNVLVDFSRKKSGEMWSKGERIQFVTAYAERLFQRQGEMVGGRRRPRLFQILDEAARYIPQVIPSGATDIAKCVGAWEQIVEEGRNIGLGVGLLTQRSARMNKSVSELADAMFAFRTVGPNSLEAILDWLGTHVEKARIKDLGEKVRGLDRGTALVISPGWLRFEGVVKVRMRTTFDSSATPDGRQAAAPKGAGSKPDLAAIEQRMATTIERAKAEDPKELRKTILELRAELKKAQAAKPAPAPAAPKVVERPVLKEAQIKRLEAVAKKFGRLAHDLFNAGGGWAETARNLEHQVRQATEAPRVLTPSVTVHAPGPIKPETAHALGKAIAAAVSSRGFLETRPQVRGENSTAIGKGERIVLEAIRDRRGPASAEYLTITTGYKKSSRNKYLQLLQAAGLVVREGEDFVLTPAGEAEVGAPEPLDHETLRKNYLAKLPKGEAEILGALIEAYPGAIEREEVGGDAYKKSSRNKYLQHLAARGLVVAERNGVVRAHQDLFA